MNPRDPQPLEIEAGQDFAYNKMVGTFIMGTASKSETDCQWRRDGDDIHIKVRKQNFHHNLHIILVLIRHIF